MSDPELLWQPTTDQIASTNLAAYERWLEQTHGLTFDDYESLWRWSVRELETFWQTIVEYFDVHFHAEPETVLDDRRMPGTRWFPGSTLNYAEHIFRGRSDAATALHHASELRELDLWTWGRLRSETAAIAHSLRNQGVGPGDRVAAYLPNIPETLAAFLACASVGATWSSAAPEFGAR